MTICGSTINMTIDRSMAIDSENFPPLSCCPSQLFQNLFRILPADTGIRDTDAILQPSFAFFGNLLSTCIIVSGVKLGRRARRFPPSLMLLSIITPMMASSPFSI